jgi:mannosyl-oligosaccharide glucosidase
VPSLENQAAPSANVFAVQRTYKLPFTLDVALVSHSAHGGDASTCDRACLDAAFDSLTRASGTTLLAAGAAQFDADFDVRFARVSQQSAPLRSLARAALSNLIGGIGYWFGASVLHDGVRTVRTPQGGQRQEAVLSRGKLVPLYSAVPSRPFFPRGFLWDEGFHQMLVAHFDASITRDVLSHWLNVMHDDG